MAVQPPRLDALMRCQRASVAVEAALIIPLAVLIFLGCYETYAYIRTVALIERATYSVADLMARQTATLIDCDNTSDALNLAVYVTAAEKIASPLALSDNGEVILSGVSTPASTAMVSWQRRSDFAIDGAASSVGKQGGTATLPSSAMTPTSGGDTLIVVELFYHFTPFAMTGNFWLEAPGATTISRRAYYRARTTRQDNLATTTGCAGLSVP